jgi:hypothetical protein
MSSVSARKISQYRQRADECLAHARATKVPATRILWLSMARDWQLLAENAEWMDRHRSTSPIGQRINKRAA